MRAGRIEQFGTRPFLADMPEPTIAEGESLVQVQAASVGHLDVTIASGRFGVSPALPYDLESAWDRLTSGEAVGRVVVQP